MGNREQLGHGLSSMDARWTTGRVILNCAGTVAAGYELSWIGFDVNMRVIPHQHEQL
jgi:hypothetical protein